MRRRPESKAKRPVCWPPHVSWVRASASRSPPRASFTEGSRGAVDDPGGVGREGTAGHRRRAGRRGSERELFRWRIAVLLAADRPVVLLGRLEQLQVAVGGATLAERLHLPG